MQPCNKRVAQFMPLVNRYFRLYVGNLARRARSPAAADRNPAPPPARRAGDGRGLGEPHDLQRTTPRTAPLGEGGPRVKSGGKAAAPGPPEPERAERKRRADNRRRPGICITGGRKARGTSAARRRGIARRPAGRRSTLDCLSPMATNIRTAWADGGGPWPPSGRLPSASDAVGRS